MPAIHHCSRKAPVEIYDDRTFKIVGYARTRAEGHHIAMTRAIEKHRGSFVVAPKPNPLSTKNVLLGVAGLGALAAIFYAVNASASSTPAPAPAPTPSPAPLPVIKVGTMPITLSQADSGYTTSALVGDGITINLPSSSWKVSDQNNGVLRYVGQTATSVVYTATAVGSDTVTITDGTTTLTYPFTVTAELSPLPVKNV